MASREPVSLITSPSIKKSPLKLPVKRKQKNELSMVAAIQAVKEGMSIQTAARKHAVPYSSLCHKVAGKVKHGNNPGRSSYLSANEEKELVDFLLLTARIGYHKTRADVARIVENIAHDKKLLRAYSLSGGWVSKFLKRHPEVTPRSEWYPITIDEETMKSYFEELIQRLNECNLNSSPMQIYTADETVLSKQQLPPSLKAIGEQEEASSKFQVTVIGCVNAMGCAVPPFVIFDNETNNNEWKTGEVPGTAYEVSSNGWINTKMYNGWFRNHFLKNAVSARPLLLLLDGNSFHYQPNFIQLARNENVIVFCLPPSPDTLDVSEPLNASLYGPTLKAHWHLACHDHVQDNPGKVITNFQFSALVNKAWIKTMTSDNIGSKFRTCGIYPYNPSASATISNHTKTTDNDEDMEASDCQRNKATNEGTWFTGDDEIYKRRYREGYNIFDESYYAWLRVNYPEYATTWRATAIVQQTTNNAKTESETNTTEPTANDEVDATQATVNVGFEATTNSICVGEAVTGTTQFEAHVKAGPQISIFQPITYVEAETQAITSQSTPNDELYRRYEEGDKFDENYYTWLQVNPLTILQNGIKLS